MEVASHMPHAPNIVFRMRWCAGFVLAALAMLPLTLSGAAPSLPSLASAAGPAAPATPSLSPALADMAARTPAKQVEVIVQLNAGTTRADAAPIVRELGGTVTRDLHIINAVVAKLPAAGARELASRPSIRAVSLNGAIKPQAGDVLATSFNHSIQSPDVWTGHGAAAVATGAGVGVAVVDTGIAGDLPDFRNSSTNPSSRVIGSAVVNPDATTAADGYGHGTHVAGIIAGNGVDSGGGRTGIAPAAHLFVFKVLDGSGRGRLGPAQQNC